MPGFLALFLFSDTKGTCYEKCHRQPAEQKMPLGLWSVHSLAYKVVYTTAFLTVKRNRI